jgi:hypothetical protein
LTFIDPVTPFLEPLSEVVKRLLDAEVTVGRSVLINYKEQQIEYNLNIGLGSDASRRERLAEKIQSYFKEPFKMERVLSFGDIIVPTDFDLKERGIVKLERGKLELNIGKLIREEKFDIASLKIVASLPDDVLASLVVPTKSSSGTGDGSKLKARLEVSLDYASAWYNKYDRFEVRDIEYYHTIAVAPATIGEVLPRDFYNKMMAAARAYQTGDKKALEFFATVNRNFLLFESDKYYAKILGVISTDNEDFEVVDVVPKMQHLDLLPGGPQLLIDINKLKSVFGEMIALSNMQTRSLNF